MEVINLAVSEVNSCNYCLAAHTLIAKNAGFSKEQTMEMRSGSYSNDPLLNVLAKLVKSMVINNVPVDFPPAPEL